MTSYVAQLRELVLKLADQTAKGNLTWQVDSVGAASSAFRAGTLQVKWDRDGSGQEAVRITIFDNLGTVKSTFDDSELLEPVSEYSDGKSWFGTMEDLLRAAQRAARGEDKIIRDLLDELDDKVPF